MKVADRRRKGEPGRAPLYVIDASALLAAFLPEEDWEAEADALLEGWQEGKVRLVAPTLTSYEILNGLYIAVRGKAGRPPRLTEAEASEAWALFQGLGIPQVGVEEVATDALELAFQHRWRSVYDMAYVAWAKRLNTKLITAEPPLAEAFPKWTHLIWEPLAL